MNIQQMIRWRDTAIKAGIANVLPDTAAREQVYAAFKAASEEWINVEVPEVLPKRQAEHLQKTLKKDALQRRL